MGLPADTQGSNPASVELLMATPRLDKDQVQRIYLSGQKLSKLDTRVSTFKCFLLTCDLAALRAPPMTSNFSPCAWAMDRAKAEALPGTGTALTAKWERAS